MMGEVIDITGNWQDADTPSATLRTKEAALIP